MARRDGEFIQNNDLFFTINILQVVKLMADLVVEDVVGLVGEGLLGGFWFGGGGFLYGRKILEG